MSSLAQVFERVYVINLKRRPDRLHSFYERLRKYGWPFKEPEPYEAIEGDVVGVPREFTQGGGAYGCRMSHLRILQDCLMQGVESVLILEDDADITDGFVERCEQFFASVPDDWEGVMLGGQHHAPPIRMPHPGIVRVRYAQRTHAYGARRSYMRALQARWGNATVHIDWMMYDWQHRQIVYAPDPWLIGQAGGRSDIYYGGKPPEWWIERDGLEQYGPVAIAQVPASELPRLRELGCHTGYTIDEETGIDAGLASIFRESVSPEMRRRELRDWLRLIQSECVAGLLPTIWHPEVSIDLVRSAWPGEVHLMEGDHAESAFSCLPERLRNAMRERMTLRRPPFVLLRCNPELIDALHSAGFHPGYWRNSETHYDMGLEKVIDTGPTQEGLAEWARVIEQEADRDGLIPTCVHPAISRDMLAAATDRQVREIVAADVEQLRNNLINPALRAESSNSVA